MDPSPDLPPVRPSFQPTKEIEMDEKATVSVGSIVLDADHGAGEVVKMIEDESTGDLHARVSFDDGFKVWLRTDSFEQVFPEDTEDE